MIKPFKEVYDCDSITINVTNNCNLNCTYCFEHAKNLQMMEPQVAIDIIDTAYNTIDKRSGDFTINIFGGEPLLNWPTIKALIDHCNKKKYKVKYGITTNLTILTDEIISYIDDNAIMMLVSIDGIKKIHNWNRCDSFKTVYSNLKKLIDADLALFVEARMTILPRDVKYAIHGIKMLIKMGVNNICPMPVTDVEWSDGDIKILEKHYIRTMEYYISQLNIAGHRNIAIKNADEVLLNIMSPEIDDPIMCPIYSNKWCAFDTNGDIYPCHQGPTSTEPFKKNMYIGNIYTGVEIDRIRIGDIHATYSKEMCKDCIGKAICKCGCPVENLRETGSEEVPSDGYCKTQIALVNAVKAFHEKILASSNIRNRMLNVLKENLKIKDYIDLIYEKTNLEDSLVISSRILHIQEMIDNLKSDNLLPTFKEYIDARLKVILAYMLKNKNITLEEAEAKVRNDTNG